VIKIQKKIADDKGVDLFATFENIADHEDMEIGNLESPMLKSDEDRIKQVLLGLQSNALKFT
jgi:signal transduction histidine kinase